MPDFAVSVSVAKAAMEHLISGQYSQIFALERSYADWTLPLERASRLRVDVVAVTTEQKLELASRGSLKYTVPVDIAVRQKFGPESQDDDTGRIELERIDDLVLLVQEIHERFAPQRLTEFSAGTWKQTEIMANPIRRFLAEYRQFTGVVRVTFEAMKAIA